MGKLVNIGYTFSPETLTSLNEAIVQEIVKAPLLNNVFGVIETGIRNERKIGFVNTSLGLMLKAPLGCNPTGSTFSGMATSEKAWTPKGVAFRNEECLTDLEPSLIQYLKNAGIDQYDLTSTDYYAFFLSYLPDNLAKNVFIKAWFDDTAADTVGNGGKLKNGTDKEYFNRIDGIFKQLTAIYTADANRKVAIAENSTDTYVLQEAITDANCTAVFNNLLKKATVNLASAPDKVYLATRSLVQGYRWDMQSKGTDTLMNKQINGIEVPTCNGIPIIEIPVWDEVIRAYFDNGTKWDNPHRAVLTTISNLAVGFEGNDAFESFDVFFDRKTKTNIVEGQDGMDAKVLRNDLVQVAI